MIRGSRSRHKSDAISLVEVLVVIAIVAVLFALVSSATVGARRAASTGVVTTHLRQLGVALAQYQEIHEGYPLFNLDPLVTTGLLSDERLLLAPGDPYPQGFGTAVAECDEPSRVPKWATSFEDALGHVGLWPFLRSVDPNPGVVVARTVGTKQNEGLLPCNARLFDFEGKILRLRLEGSVQVRRFRLQDHAGQPVFSRPRLFTDEWKGVP